jgi:hypothetical protein
LPDIIRVINSRWMRWAGHVARTGDVRKAYKVLVRMLKGGGHLGDLVVDGRTILK